MYQPNSTDAHWLRRGVFNRFSNVTSSWKVSPGNRYSFPDAQKAMNHDILCKAMKEARIVLALL